MTSSDLRQVFDDVTAELPVEVSVVPLESIHGRVRRHRTRRVSVIAAALAIMATVGAAIPFFAQRDPAPAEEQPTAKWSFGYLDGTQLTVYAQLDECSQLPDRRAEVVTSDGAVTVRLLGTPVKAPSCYQSGLQEVAVTLSDLPFDGVVWDGADGLAKPVYNRAELPTWSLNGAHDSGRVSPLVEGDDPATFFLQFHREDGGIGFRGTGLTSRALSTVDGEPIRLGSITAWLLQDWPGTKADSYRVAWQSPRGGEGDQWIGYETTFTTHTKREELANLLKSMIWP